MEDKQWLEEARQRFIQEHGREPNEAELTLHAEIWTPIMEQDDEEFKEHMRKAFKDNRQGFIREGEPVIVHNANAVVPVQDGFMENVAKEDQPLPTTSGPFSLVETVFYDQSGNRISYVKHDDKVLTAGMNDTIPEPLISPNPQPQLSHVAIGNGIHTRAEMGFNDPEVFKAKVVARGVSKYIPTKEQLIGRLNDLQGVYAGAVKAAGGFIELDQDYAGARKVILDVVNATLQAWLEAGDVITYTTRFVAGDADDKTFRLDVSFTDGRGTKVDRQYSTTTNAAHDQIAIRNNASHITREIARLRGELERWQTTCKHPHAERIARSDTGNWCAADDRSWYDCTCPCCGKKWREDQ